MQWQKMVEDSARPRAKDLSAPLTTLKKISHNAKTMLYATNNFTSGVLVIKNTRRNFSICCFCILYTEVGPIDTE